MTNDKKKKQKQTSSSGFSTVHVDVRKMCNETNKITTANELEWAEFFTKTLKHILDYCKDASKTDDDADEILDAIHDDMQSMMQRHVDGMAEVVAKFSGDSYQVGWHEGHYYGVMQYSKMLKELIEEETLSDPFGTLSRVINMTNEQTKRVFDKEMAERPATIIVPIESE